MENSKKTIWVLFIGPPAVGKFTVAKKIARRLNYHFFHNHQVIDFLKEVMPKEIYLDRKIYRYDLTVELLKIFAKNNISLTTTLAYADDYVTEHGISFSAFVKLIEKIIDKKDGIFVVVHLKASLSSLLVRTVSESRKEFHKIHTKKLLRKVYKANDFETSPQNIKNMITINTDDKTENQVVNEVLIGLQALGEQVEIS